MFHIKVKKRILNHAQKQVEKYNFGQRGFADGSKEQQLTGIIGQCCVAELFGEPLVDGSTGVDDGYDIEYQGIRIDVKTMGRKLSEIKPHFVNNLLAAQKNRLTDIYLFTSFNRNENILTVVGWSNKEAIYRDATLHKKGSRRTRDNKTWFKTFADLYEVETQYLAPVKSFDDLCQQLDLFSELGWSKNLNVVTKSGHKLRILSEDILALSKNDNPSITIRLNVASANRVADELFKNE